MKIVFISFFLVNFLFAHKLNLFLFEEENNIYISSYFASGTPCKKCKVEIFNKEKELIINGLTNKNGEYIIKSDEVTILVRVEAVGGHAVEKQFKLKSLNSKKDIINKKPIPSIYQSIIAIILIIIIFLLLKRIKK